MMNRPSVPRLGILECMDRMNKAEKQINEANAEFITLVDVWQWIKDAKSVLDSGAASTIEVGKEKMDGIYHLVHALYTLTEESPA